MSITAHPKPGLHTVVPSDALPAITFKDVCDRCPGAKADAVVSMGAAGNLYFCGSHWRRFRDKLPGRPVSFRRDEGTQFVDYREQIDW